MIIREDKHGLYIRGRNYSKKYNTINDPAYRPGYFSGSSHVWNTSDAGLKAGDKPQATHVNGAPFVRIKLADGKIAYWGSRNRQEGDFKEEL